MSLFDKIFIYSTKEESEYRQKQAEIATRLKQNPTTSTVLSVVDDPECARYADSHDILNIVLRELHSLQLQVALLKPQPYSVSKVKTKQSKKKSKRKSKK